MVAQPTQITGSTLVDQPVNTKDADNYSWSSVDDLNQSMDSLSIDGKEGQKEDEEEKRNINQETSSFAPVNVDQPTQAT